MCVRRRVWELEATTTGQGAQMGQSDYERAHCPLHRHLVLFLSRSTLMDKWRQ
jgi:hypothetical protein